MGKPLPEGCRFDDDLHSPGQLTVSGERVIDLNGSIVLRLADIRGDVDVVLLQRPRRRTSGPENAGSRSVGLSGNTE